MSKIRILIADDHYIVRNGLESLIGAQDDMEVVANASNAQQAFDLYSQTHPDIALVDLRMPDQTGDQLIRQLRIYFPNARVLVFSAFSGDEDIHKALEAGAQGFILKSSIGESLVEAIRHVAAGNRWLPGDVTTQLAMRRSYEPLTAREIEVLLKIAKGKSNKEIAQLLDISDYTVKDHIKNILGKLHVASRTEAVTLAIYRGIIDLVR